MMHKALEADDGEILFKGAIQLTKKKTGNLRESVDFNNNDNTRYSIGSGG
jgi:hypothetical protein